MKKKQNRWENLSVFYYERHLVKQIDCNLLINIYINIRGYSERALSTDETVCLQITLQAQVKMDDLSDDGDDFTPLTEMPTLRLTDIIALLEKKNSCVVNVDACLPPKDAGEMVLKTILYKISKCVKVLSLRFNQLSLYSCDLIIQWIATNDHLEMLYIMGSNIDERNRTRLEEAWKRKLIGHRTENMGYTFIRVTADKALLVDTV